MTTTTPAVVDRTTGEVLDLADASDEQLARFCTNAQDLREELADAEAQVHRELVARLDRNASWTLRVGDPTGEAQWEITAPSPSAGTESYPPVDLERELRALVERGTITSDAARTALKRTVTLVVAPEWDADLDDLVDIVNTSEDVRIAGVPVTIVSAAADRKSVAAGVKALRKVPGTGAALDRAKLPLPGNSRRPKVKKVTRDA